MISLVYIITFRFSYDPWEYHQQRSLTGKEEEGETNRVIFKMNKL